LLEHAAREFALPLVLLAQHFGRQGVGQAGGRNGDVTVAGVLAEERETVEAFVTDAGEFHRVAVGVARAQGKDRLHREDRDGGGSFGFYALATEQPRGLQMAAQAPEIRKRQTRQDLVAQRRAQVRRVEEHGLRNGSNRCDLDARFLRDNRHGGILWSDDQACAETCARPCPA
jgi:hypothetical protein